MMKWFRKNKADSANERNTVTENTTLPVSEEPKTTAKKSFFSQLKENLGKTRQQLGDGIGRLLLGQKEVDAALLEELETLLLTADIGMDTTNEIIDELTKRLERRELANGDALHHKLKTLLTDKIKSCAQPLQPETEPGPFVILMVGINGAGKTTTIGKLARQYQQQGKKVMLAAGDTFRAAAVEQLQVWGERNQIPVVAQQTGADSASVLYDALQSAKARKMDILIADTAGRLHTQTNLMDELKKVKRVLNKLDAQAPHEIMLVLDASIGQNAVNQAKEFHDAVQLTGITMTKLDGTARGGILFAIAHHLKIPFRYIGIGEGIDDLRPFDAQLFVDALFNDD